VNPVLRAGNREFSQGETMRTDRQTVAGGQRVGTETPRTLSATTMIGDKVVNGYGEDLGKIEELMIDLENARVGYAVLSFGGLLGIGDKLFAIPLEALRLDAENHCFVLDIDRERLEQAPGFDKDDWPEADDLVYRREVFAFYGHDPYWE
jgi:sporulation protein YlmC with PRC-barrel domain